MMQIIGITAGAVFQAAGLRSQFGVSGGSLSPIELTVQRPQRPRKLRTPIV